MFIKRLTDTQFGLLLLFPLILLLFFLNGYPIIYSFWLSLTNYDISKGTSDFIGFLNYYNLFLKDPYFLNSLGVTLRFAIEATILSTILGLGIALLLNENFKGRSFMRALVLLPWAFSTYAVATLFRYFLAQNVGFLSSFIYSLGLTKEMINFLTIEHAIDFVSIAFAWNIAPLGAFFLLANLQVIPEDLFRQAKIDRANIFQRFRYVIFPFLKYPLIVVLILNNLFSVTETTLILILTGGGPGVSTQVLSYWAFAQSFMNYSFGYGAAISWVLVLIALMIGLIYFSIVTKLK
ncbi:MAG: sugar ABC transporter permease [Candidatus Aenigmatarchaeota archaeon]